jgi:L-alanine-DL-glutamate epimerase-like enolase superfamily enzyme
LETIGLRQPEGRLSNNRKEEKAMKISNIEAILVRAPIPPERHFTNETGLVTNQEALLVRVTTEGGVVGYGETTVDHGARESVLTQVNSVFAPMLKGQSAHDITRLWESMYNGSRTHYALDRGHGFPVAAMRRGVSVAAISAVDMALWDVKGKALGAPVWQLLGGKVRDRLPTYGSGGWAKENGIGDEFRRYIEYGGFRAVKMRVGVIDGTMSATVRRVQAARKALGPDIDIMVDAHGTFTVSEAKRFCRLVTDCNLAWFEEPVSPNDMPGCAEVRASTDIPIASGERCSTRYDVMDLLQHRTIDVLQPELAVCGGLTEGVRIAGLAAGFNVRLAPHNWGTCILYAANMAYAAATPNVFIMEHCMGADPLIRDLPHDPFVSKGGWVEVRDAPGLGVTIDEDYLKRYRVN